MNTARIAAIQLDCAVADKKQNLKMAEKHVRLAAEEGARLACLPELFLTGFDRKQLHELAEPLDGPSISHLSDLARELGVWIVAGFAERCGNVFYNSAAILGPQGFPPGGYRKNHLYGEDEHYFAPGNAPCLIDTPFARIAITICFDFCFPEYIQSLVKRGAELIVHPTAWFTHDDPGYRNRSVAMTRNAGVPLLTANHCGPITAEGDLRGVGHSAIIWKDGEILGERTEGPGIAAANIPPLKGKSA